MKHSQIHHLLKALCLCLVLGVWLPFFKKPLPVFADGVDWTQYLMASEYIWRYDPSLHYPTWRSPVYPYLLGLFGDWEYIATARFWNTMGAFLSLLSIAMLFWTRKWVAIILMVAFYWHPLTQDALDYINPYPLLGGVVSLAISCSLLFAETTQRNRMLWLAFGAGSLWGLGIAIDGRTWMVAPVFLRTLFVFWKRKPNTFKSTLVVFLLGFSLPVGFQYWLIQSFDLQLLSMWEKLIAQRAFLFRDSMEFQLFPETRWSAIVANVCMGQSSDIIGWADIWNSCSYWMFVGNWHALVEHQIVPSHWILIGLAGLFFCCKGNSNEGLLGLVTVLLLQVLLSFVLWSPPRYWFMMVVVLLICFGKVLNGWLEKRVFWGSALLVGTLGLWLWNAEPIHSQDIPKQWEKMAPKLSKFIGQEVVDCSGENWWLIHLRRSRAPNWSFLLKHEACEQVLLQSDVHLKIVPIGERMSVDKWSIIQKLDAKFVLLQFNESQP